MRDTYISEIFGSIQGEGIHVGLPAVFIRFGGCNLACSYCDTEYARSRSEAACIYAGGKKHSLKNPVGNDTIVSLVGNDFGAYPTVVMTGGEPLVQAASAGDLAGRLRMAGYSVHLETNGSLAAGLGEVRDGVDFVCMDYKLPVTQGGRGLEAEHHAFLEGLTGVDAAVKIVVTDQAPPGEIDRAARVIAGVNRHVPVLLQPAFTGSLPNVSVGRLLDVRSRLAKVLSDVRISIQLHKILGVR